MAAALVSAGLAGDMPDLSVEQKRVILRNARSLNGALAPYVIDKAYDDAQFIPDLTAVAADLKVDPRIRSAAMVQLHKMGVNDFRDAIVADLMHPYPVLTSAAHHSIGKLRITGYRPGASQAGGESLCIKVVSGQQRTFAISASAFQRTNC